MTAMVPFDARRVDLLEAFCREPFGPFTPETERFARWVYFQPGPRRWVLRTIRRHAEWQLARYAGARGTRLEDFPVRFTSLSEAAADIARRRWREEVIGETPEAGELSNANPLASHLLGYCEPWSVAPSERLAVKVSASGAESYSIEAVRIVCGDDSPRGPGLDLRPVELGQPPRSTARAQVNATGSYVRVPNISGCNAGLTVQCYVSAWLPLRGAQEILSAGDSGEVGWSLGLTAHGELQFTLFGTMGAARVTLAGPFVARAWYFISGRYHAADGRMELAVQRFEAGEIRRGLRRAKTIVASTAIEFPPLDMIIGARAGNIGIHDVFNGRIERARIAPRWLSDAELILAALHRPQPALLAELLGAWDFGFAFADVLIHDLTPHAHHGQSVNLPTRGVTGVAWDGTHQDPQFAPNHYAAIHFHEDDLYDAGWETDFEVHIPSDLPSGCYALRLSTPQRTAYLSFFVRPPRNRATAPLAFLASTATYIAYGNYRFQLELPISGSVLVSPIVLELEHVLLQETSHLGLSQYDRHLDGSGVHHASRRRPIINHGPCTTVWNFNADTHLLKWLDGIGQPFDVITDEDLDHEGQALLDRYRCVVTGSHPEYCSTSMRSALAGYRDNGGRLMYLGGNGFYWRIAWHPTLSGVTEVRRPETGARYWVEEPGEANLAFNGEYGGLWRAIGRAPETLVGIGTRAIGFERSAPYLRTAASVDPRVGFMFSGLDDVQTIGESGFVGGAAAGSELDAASVLKGTPDHALIVATAWDLPPSAQPVPENLLMCHPAQSASLDHELRADMVFFETGEGGAVFAVGSVAFAGALLWKGGDNNASRLTSNVLQRFLASTPFEVPGSLDTIIKN